MNHMLKAVMLSSVMALGTMLFGCGNVSSPGDPVNVGETSSEVESACDAFCQSQGGSFFRGTSATSQSSCRQSGGSWFTSLDGYTGSQPGCCCKCTLASGACL